MKKGFVDKKMLKKGLHLKRGAQKRQAMKYFGTPIEMEKYFVQVI